MPLVAILSIVIFAPVQSLWIWLTPLPDTIQEQLDASVDHGFDGIIVYVDKAGQSPVSYAAGWKNTENKVPAGPHDLFKIASISKLYIAAATVKLIEARRLSPDDTLGTFGNAPAVSVMSGYDSHYEGDVKTLDFVAPGGSMIASAQDVGIFLRALNNGTLFNGNEQSIYSGLYEYEQRSITEIRPHRCCSAALTSRRHPPASALHLPQNPPA